MTNSEIANALIDNEFCGDFAVLLETASQRIGCDGDSEVISSAEIIQMILSNRFSSTKVFWLKVLAERVLLKPSREYHVQAANH